VRACARPIECGFIERDQVALERDKVIDGARKSAKHAQSRMARDNYDALLGEVGS
jgi:hypothetical protein